MALTINFKVTIVIFWSLLSAAWLQETTNLPVVAGGSDGWRLGGVCDVSQCNDPTRCTMAGDLLSCKCRMGYYGSLCDQDAKISVLCTKDFMKLSVAEGYFHYYNTPMTSLHFPDKTCPTKCAREVIGTEAFWITNMPKEQYAACGGRPLEKNVTHIIYSLTLQSEPRTHGNIIRDPIIQIDYKCIYPYQRMVSLPFALEPHVMEAQLRVDDIDATIEMSLFTDKDYTQVYTSAPTIELLDTVYVQVKVTEPEDFFNLRLNDCWATQTEEPNATESGLMSHMLLDDGCVTEDTDETFSFVPMPDSLIVYHGPDDELNGDGSTVRFSFQMFRFRAEPHQLYLHCSLVICENDQAHADDCRPVCPPPKAIVKRDVATTGLDHGLLSYGPIKISMPQPAESSGVMKMVALPVAGIWVVGLVLVLLIAVAKAGNKRLQPLQENH